MKNPFAFFNQLGMCQNKLPIVVNLTDKSKYNNKEHGIDKPFS